jgi:hypothetical protein
MEGRHSFDNIIGGTPEERESAEQYFQKRSDEKSERILQYEIEKTPGDKEIIERTMVYVDQVAARYTDKVKPISEDKIFLLKKDGVEAMEEGRLLSGVYNPVTGNIAVDQKDSKIGMAGTIAHELFHAKAYKSWRISSKERRDDLYRHGLQMIDIKNPQAESGTKQKYFSVMDEAIVEKLASQAIELIEQDPLFREESEATKQLLNFYLGFARRNGKSPEFLQRMEDEFRYVSNAQKRLKSVLDFSEDQNDREDYTAGMFKALAEKSEIGGNSRDLERIKFDKLLDEIVEKSSGRFANREEVFTEFAKAHFSGDYLNIARIVEGILGKGSFRKIANDFSGSIEKNAPAADIEG